MKDVLTISEISALFNLNVQTLHYYDKIGLLEPDDREANGTRLYRFEQLYKLATIRYLKNLGYSLKQILVYMDSRDVRYTLNHLKTQSNLIKKKWDELRRIDEAIQRKIVFVEEKLKEIEIEKVETRHYPQRYYFPIGSEEALYGSKIFYFYPTVVFYEGESKQFGAFLTKSSDHFLKERKLQMIPEGEYLCGYHAGPYEAIELTFKKLEKRGDDMGLTLAKRRVNLNIIDQFVERNSARYITEVQIPILPHFEVEDP